MIRAVLFIIWGFFILVSPVYAVSVTISNTPSSITDQPFNIDVSVSGAGAGTNYLRANLFQTGTTSYFGYTYNGSSFINSSTYSDYFPITIDSSSNWSGTIQAKLDASSSYYKGPGSYNLKVRRYTQSGSSYTWSNEVPLTVSLATLTPSPTPIPSSSSSTSSSTPNSSFTISDTPSQINSDQSFTVSVNLSLPENPNHNFYLKGAFKKPDSSNYFGLTKVAGSWVKNGSSYSNQYSITTDASGNWSGSLEIQPDSEDSGFTGTGDYIFKVGRYTSSGSGPTWSNEAAIKIILVENNDQGGTSANTSSTNPSTSPQPFQNQVSKSPTKQVKSSSKQAYQIASVAGAAATSSATPSAAVEVKSEKQLNFLPWIGGVFVMAGISSLIFIYLRGRKSL